MLQIIQREIKKGHFKEEFGLRLFLSLALQRTIDEVPKEGSEVMKEWMGEQLALSAEVLFPVPFEA